MPPQTTKADEIRNAIRGLLIMHWLKVSGAGLVLIIGIIMQAATGSRVALCNSLVGQLGQEFSAQANESCSAANWIHDLGTGFMWIGIIGLVVTGLYL